MKNSTSLIEIPASGRFDAKHDLPASIVVFLVALPLSMGIAIASGAPPTLGLYSAIIGGIVVGLLSGSPMQVSGPAAGLSVIVFQLVQEQGLAALGIIVLLAGLIQLGAGLMKFGQYFRAVSPAVIEGMLAGIGVLIFFGQFHVMVDDKPRSDGLSNILSIPSAVMKGIFPMDDSSHHLAAMVGLCTLAVLLLWKPFTPKFLKVIPAPLAGVIVGTALASLLGWSVQRVDVPAAIQDSIQFVALPAMEASKIKAILIAAATLALVASAETLLCASAVDKMHTGPRTNYDREMVAQGVGNMLAGSIGALPITGVIVRSSANVLAGGRSRWSGVFHGAWILLLVAIFPQLLRLIPTASLAAILVYTGAKLMNPRAIIDLARFGHGEVFIHLTTMLTIVFTDLLTGVLVGIGLSALRLLYRFTHLRVNIEVDRANNRTDLHLEGAATFLRKPQLANVLESVPKNHALHVHLKKLSFIDHACLELFIDWDRLNEASGGDLIMDWDRLMAVFRHAPVSNSTGTSESNGAKAPSAANPRIDETGLPRDPKVARTRDSVLSGSSDASG